MKKQIDLNSDLGESFGQWQMGNDEAILSVVSSANVACGFHAGSPEGILKTLKAAKENGVAVGAHVGYPDLVGFGRRNMDIASSELIADVIYQIGALKGLATAAGTDVLYVKPHGALYNTIAHDKRQAIAVIDAIKSIDNHLILVALAGSPLIGWAQDSGLQVVAEAFADRAYNSDGTLVSRKLAGSVLHDPKIVAERMLQLVQEGGVVSIDGKFTPIDAGSICVHGDSPGALEMAQQVRSILEKQGIEIYGFAHKGERE
ncbi:MULTISPECIES: LamB/YcsF family protein [Providencia]|uniref:LamB/YcsF family protein n=1 Tax=Providencia TaxID=586 RepID=UPI00197E01CD|nr:MULTISPECIES: 5-oxoprolinase subunit PxpA [Providencia]MBN4863512.1 LamB/YcsF family protein [Providencia stuartii]MBN4872834.1 LamB/YcsF family protein [Providencia stuartii]MBN4878045.1 LamB/YcsF family protein [Providencia stuartii]MBN4882035.1 LamB/YcsF family protein [Providencia stuartii]